MDLGWPRDFMEYFAPFLRILLKMNSNSKTTVHSASDPPAMGPKLQGLGQKNQPLPAHGGKAETGKGPGWEKMDPS